MTAVTVRRTKIVATLGPATTDAEAIRAVLAAGVDVVRLNFSHGSHEEHRARAALVRHVAEELGRTVAILQDLQGPKVRLGTLAGGAAELSVGEEVLLVPDDGTPGDPTRLPVSLPDLAARVHPGASVLVNDGLVRLRVVSVEDEAVRTAVLAGGPVGDRKGVNLPGIPLGLPSLTEKDRADLAVGQELGVDFVALSFVREAGDLRLLREALAELDSRAGVVAKIETLEAVERIDGIVAEADAVMVARGDLGVEVPPEEVPRYQKAIVRRCRREAKAAIIATQMLESMVHSPTPTRAEASDVANAVEDGAAALMLSAETSIGSFAPAAVATMARVAVAAETDLCVAGWCELEPAAAVRGVPPPVPSASEAPPDDLTAALGQAAVRLAADLGAAAIVTPTQSGGTARLVSRYRPFAPILAVSPDPLVRRRLALEWGVVPLTGGTYGSTDAVLREAIRSGRTAGLLRVGDLVVVTGGFPTGTPGSTNLIKVERVGED